MSKKRAIGGSSFIALGLGALGGCSDPTDAPTFEPAELFTSIDVRKADSMGHEAWKAYLDAKTLHAAWVPSAKSPWRAYYKPTLPAAISIVRSAAKPIHASSTASESAVAEMLKRLAPDQCAFFIDLPGEESVVWGVQLAKSGLQPVLTFNNWPHPKGSIPLERSLGALLFYAAEMESIRKAGAMPATAKPVFLLESRRISAAGGPSKFDNRYYHVAADFPDASKLKGQGVRTIVYVVPQARASYGGEDDLNEYFTSLHAAGIAFLQIQVNGSSADAVAWAPVKRTTIFQPGTTGSSGSTGSRTYGRSYRHYHHYWSGSRSTWGSGSSGGGGSGYS